MRRAGIAPDRIEEEEVSGRRHPSGAVLGVPAGDAGGRRPVTAPADPPMKARTSGPTFSKSMPTLAPPG